MIRKSYCRICAGQCGILVDVEDNRVLSVRADVNHPVSGGYSCSKGRAAGETQHSEKRLRYPTIRKGDVMLRVGWDEALDDLAVRLRGIIDEFGPDAVGVFMGAGVYADAAGLTMMGSMLSALGTRSRYSDVSIDVLSKIVVGEMVSGFSAMPFPDFGRCRMVVYVGTNPVVSLGHTSMLNNPTARLRQMTRDGEVWVLDPRRTETAARATRHLQARPGTDYAILAYLVRELLRSGADWDYLNQHAQDVDELRVVVEPFTLGHASAISNVPEQDLIDFLAAVRRAGRLSVEAGTGITMSPAANITTWMCWALMVVTGSVDREGGAWCNPGFLARLDERDMPGAPEEGWRAPGPRSRPELRTVRGRGGDEFVCAAMADEIMSGNLRALINLSGNLVACMPDTERTLAALRKLDVLATIDIAANAMGPLSTHVLPTKHMLERVEVSLICDTFLPEIAAQFTPAVVKAGEEVRSYWWILAQLGKRMGLDFIPGVDPDISTDKDVVDIIAGRGRLPIDTDGEATYVVADERAFGWVRRNVDRLGGFRLAPPELVAQLAELKPPAGLMLISRRQARHFNSRKVNSKHDPAAIYVNPEDARERRLDDGDVAILRSAHGQIQGCVKLDPTLARGALALPHGWEGTYNVNQLTSGYDVDKITGMPCFSNLPVELTKVVSAGPRPAFGHA